MSYLLIPKEVAEALLPLLDDDRREKLRACLYPTDAVPLALITPELSAQDFHRAFVRPLEGPAERAGLLLGVIVAEPSTDGSQLRAVAVKKLTVLPPATGARRVLKNLLREFAETT